MISAKQILLDSINSCLIFPLNIEQVKAAQEKLNLFFEEMETQIRNLEQNQCEALGLNNDSQIYLLKSILEMNLEQKYSERYDF